MEELQKVENHPNLRKGNGSVINNNTSEYQRRLSQIRQQKRIVEIETNQIQMQATLDEIMKRLIALQGEQS